MLPRYSQSHIWQTAAIDGGGYALNVRARYSRQQNKDAKLVFRHLLKIKTVLSLARLQK
jgi:hypothetical protein